MQDRQKLLTYMMKPKNRTETGFPRSLSKFFLLCSQPECLRRKPVHKNTCHNRIDHAKCDTGDPEYQDRHPDLHQEKADQIGDRQNDLIHPAFHLCSRIIRLQQIVDRQVMDREKHAHAEDRYK